MLRCFCFWGIFAHVWWLCCVVLSTQMQIDLICLLLCGKMSAISSAFMSNICKFCCVQNVTAFTVLLMLPQKCILDLNHECTVYSFQLLWNYKHAYSGTTTIEQELKKTNVPNNRNWNECDAKDTFKSQFYVIIEQW